MRFVTTSEITEINIAVRIVSMWLHLLSFRETAAIYYSIFFYKYLQIFNNFYVFIGTALMAVQQAASLKKAGSLWEGRQVLEKPFDFPNFSST